jgi:hypothetical protein
MMRRVALAFCLSLLALPVFAEESALRLRGIAFAEGEAEEIQIQVWAMGEQVAEHPEWQFEAVFDGIVAPGKPFSVDLGEARLPVLVELSAESHGAVSLQVVLPEQLDLPPAWLRRGDPLKISVSPMAKSADEAIVWGDVVSDFTSGDSRRWRPAIAHHFVGSGGALDAIVPPGSYGARIFSVHPDGHFRTEDVRMSGKPQPVRLDLATREVPVKVWDQRGRPVAGVRVVEASSPFEVAAASDEGGRAAVRVPVGGQWKIVALDDELMGMVLGRDRPEGELAIDLAPRNDLTLTWEEWADPLVIEPNWLPRALGRSPRSYSGGSVRLPKVEDKASCRFWSPWVATGVEWYDGSIEAVALSTRTAVSLEGRVVHADGQPAPGNPVWVRLARRSYYRSGSTPGTRGANQPLSRPWLPWAVSGADGSFSVAGLPPSEIQAEVLAPGLPTARGERLTGKEGGRLETTVVLQPGATLAFTVTDPHGIPLEGVSADVYRSNLTKTGGAGTMTVARTRDRGDPELTGMTDAEGRAKLAQVPVGVVRLRLSRPGSVTRTFDGIEVPVEGKDLGDLVLEPGVTLRGTTVGPDGEVVANAEVAVGADPRMQFFRPETTSDDQGLFLIPDLAMSGIIYLQARAEGLVPMAPLAVEMPPEGEVEVAMATERKLEGVALDSRDDAPVVGARIVLSAQYVANPGSAMIRSPRRVGDATTDSSGAFVFDGLVGGSQLELTVTASGLQRATREVAIPVEADPKPLIVRLEKGFDLQGLILDSEGEPAAGVRVAAMPESQAFEMRVYGAYSGTISGSDGRFRFDDLAPGKVTVSARSEDGLEAREVAEAGQSEEVVLRFERGLTVEGVVLDPESAPVAGAEVTVYGECIRNYVRYETAGDGLFELTGAKPAPCTMGVRAEGFVRKERQIEVPGGGLRGLEIRLERGATVVGQVRGLASSELENCYVVSDGAVSQPGMDGSFRLAGVGVGERVITARVSGSDRERSVRATVPEAGESDPVVIDFALGISLFGRVLRGSDGVPGMVVSANGVGARAYGSASSGPDGAYRIEGLEPGEFQVAVQSRGGDVVGGDHVLLEADTELDVQIASGRIAGNVVTSDSGEPIDGATVTIKGRGLPPVDRRTTTDASGFFQAFDLAEGGYVVHADAPERSPAQEVVTVSEGMVAEVVLSLEAERSTVFVVRGPDGRSPSNISILSARGGVFGPMLVASCSSGGRCEVDELPPGRWTLMVASSTNALALLVVDLPQNEVPVILRRTGKLELTAPADETGAVWQVRLIEAATGIVVPIHQWANPGRSEWVPVAVSGFSHFLPEGVWLVEAYAPGGTQSVHEVTVTAGATTDLRLGE